MSKNIFEELHQRKANLLQFAEKAKSFGWIDEEQEKELKEKLKSDVLTIGVIGQMKSGKSTFLNAFVFEDAVLPAAISPMTATLSVITYGEQKKVVAEFYTQGEWEELKAQEARSLDEVKGDVLEESKVKAAKELMKKNKELGNNVGSYLGKIQEDSFENLVEYVGRDGKFVPITKSVTIYYPKEYLKGVRIVDTPGFNDPIVSRELRTKQFLKEADAVVMMLYAGQAFGATDQTILFEDVKQCGIGKVVIGINKYDLPYENGILPQSIKQSVIDKIHKTCAEYKDETMTDILKDADPILLSAEMALLSSLPMEVIKRNESYNKAFHRYCDETYTDPETRQLHNLGIPYARFREESKIDELANAIKMLVEKEKYDILLKKPLNAIWGAGCKKRDEIVAAITKNDTELKILSTPDEELEGKERNLSKAETRINRRIEALGENLDITIRTIAKKGKNELEDAMDYACKKMIRVVDSVGRFGNFNTIKPRLDQIANEFETRTSRRLVEQITDNIKHGLKSITNNFFTDAEEIFVKFVPDIDGHEFVDEIARKINLQINDESVFEKKGTGEGKGGGVWGHVLNAGIMVAFGLIGLGAKSAIVWVFRGMTHDEKKIEILNKINYANKNFDPQPYIDIILQSKDNTISMIKKMFVDEFIEPLKEKVESFRANLADRASRLEQAEILKETLSIEYDKINKQIEEIRSLKETM